MFAEVDLLTVVAVLKMVRQTAEPASEHASEIVPAIVVNHVPELAITDTHCKARHGAEAGQTALEEPGPVAGSLVP